MIFIQVQKNPPFFLNLKLLVYPMTFSHILIFLDGGKIKKKNGVLVPNSGPNCMHMCLGRGHG